MPFVTQLSTDLQNALLKDIVSGIGVEVILDPDGKALDISNYVDRNASLVIQKQKSILPYGSLGAFTVKEVRLRLINKDDYFNHYKKSSPFYYATTRLFAAKPASQGYIDVPKGDGDKYQKNMIINIIQGEDREQFTVGDIDTTTYTDFDRINVGAPGGGPGSIDFDAGSLVETDTPVGKKVVIRTVVDGVSDKIDQFWGYVKGLPKLYRDYVELEFFDMFRALLDEVCKANSYKILTSSVGDYENTRQYTYASTPSGSSVTLDMDDIEINPARCKIGSWEIEFINATDYYIRDPDNLEMQGDINTDFYFGTSTRYQIKIPKYAWGGFPETGDKITFQTVLSLGLPVNSYDTIPQMIYRLLLESFGAGLTTADLDDAQFQDVISKMDEMRGAISFTSPVTVLKAIELLQQHINATVFITNGGKFSIDVYMPRKQTETYPAFSPSADIRELQQQAYGKIERIYAKYNFGYNGKNYEHTVVVPNEAQKATTRLNLNFPAYHAGDYGQAKSTAERIWLTWRDGQRVYEIVEKWNYGLALDINERYQIQSTYPDVEQRRVEVFEITKDLLNGEVHLKAFDIEHIFNNYAFTDIDYCDRAAVTW